MIEGREAKKGTTENTDDTEKTGETHPLFPCSPCVPWLIYRLSLSDFSNGHKDSTSHGLLSTFVTV